MEKPRPRSTGTSPAPRGNRRRNGVAAMAANIMGMVMGMGTIMGMVMAGVGGMVAIGATA
jgi:hypothetical protein